MSETATSCPVVRFGVFEADFRSRELRRSGLIIRLQDQPFRVLMLLLESPGVLVSREELQHKVWGTDAEIDLDHSLKTAINKIREALKDSADTPRFIETLPRRGYRFIAPVTILPGDHAEDTTEATEQAILSPPQQIPFTITEAPTQSSVAAQVLPPPAPVAAPTRRPRFWAVCLVLCLPVVFTMIVLFRTLLSGGGAKTSPRTITQITFAGRTTPSTPNTENFAPISVGGLSLYLTQIEQGLPMLAQASISDGEVNPLSVPPEIAEPIIDDLSVDESKLLVHNHLIAAEIEQALWIVPTHGGMARRIPNIVAHAATWMPDGKRVLYAKGNGLYTVNEDGSSVRPFAAVPGRSFWLHWSPDGNELRFTILDSYRHTSKLWRIGAAGGAASLLLPQWSEPDMECCGSWTADGRYFVFQSSHSGMSNIWTVDEKAPELGRRQPTQITSGPLAYQSPVPARSGHRIFFLGTEPRYAQFRYEPGQKSFNASPVNMFGTDRTEFSRNGEWVAWIRNRDGSLWCGHSDGTNKIQISSPPTQAWLMHWSPDGRQLAYMGRQPGQPWKIYIVDNASNSARMLLREDRNEADPDWSPDGSHIIFGRLPDFMSTEIASKDIEIIGLKDGSVISLPGSRGLYAPRWSPDGRHIAAMPLNQSRLLLFDTETHTWRVLLDRKIANPTWASDGRSLFFQAFAEKDQPIYRVWLANGHVDRIIGLSEMPDAGIVDFSFSSLAPHDVPLVRARTWTANIFALDLDK